jgi:hypothetical protein
MVDVLVRYEPGPSHPYPRVRLSDGRIIREHRWIIEQERGTRLSSREHVHHKDEDPANNVRSNLEVKSPSDHTRGHKKPAPRAALECPECREKFEVLLRTIRGADPTRVFHCSRSCARRGTGRRKRGGEEVPHGTSSGYSYFRCRCDRCRAARAARIKKARQKHTRA